MRCGTEIYLTMESKIFYQWGHIIWRIEVERQFPKKGYKPNNIPTYFWWRFKKNFYWDTVAFSIVEQNQSAIHIQISTPFWTFFWFRSSQSLKYEFPLLYSMFSLVWLSFFVIIVSIVYMCQSQSPNSSYPPHPPWYPYIWSLCLCLYCSFANKVIYTCFLDSIYMR